MYRWRTLKGPRLNHTLDSLRFKHGLSRFAVPSGIAKNPGSVDCTVPIWNQDCVLSAVLLIPIPPTMPHILDSRVDLKSLPIAGFNYPKNGGSKGLESQMWSWVTFNKSAASNGLASKCNSGLHLRNRSTSRFVLFLTNWQSFVVIYNSYMAVTIRADSWNNPACVTRLTSYWKNQDCQV